MNLTTAYVTVAIRGERQLLALAQSALPDAPVVPDPERAPLLDRVRQRVRSAARLLTDCPPPTTQNDTVPAQG